MNVQFRIKMGNELFKAIRGTKLSQGFFAGRNLSDDKWKILNIMNQMHKRVLDGLSDIFRDIL